MLSIIRLRKPLLSQLKLPLPSWTPHRRLSTTAVPSNPPRPHSPLNPLGKLISQVIEVTGPISLSGYMRQCLTNPEYGYYTTRDPLGAKGDFITSPEISQMFGELIGVWFFSIWLSQNGPKRVRFVEFGPGKGTLLSDCLRSFNKLLRDKHVEQEIVLVEASPVLRDKQHSIMCHENLNAPADDDFWYSVHKYGGKIIWVDTEKDVLQLSKASPVTTYVIAHEFFDALPIKKFIKTAQGWRELLVDFNPTTGKFHLIQSPSETPSSYIPKTSERYDEQPVGTVVEISQDLFQYSENITQLVKSSGNNTGASLIIDYGPSESIPANSLRGILDHKFVDPFIKQGDIDLSVDVDFQAIASIVDNTKDLKPLGPMEQGDWLIQMGIQKRAEDLYKVGSSEEERASIIRSFSRLVGKDDQGMGKVYKFLGIVPSSTKAYGFQQ